MAHSFSQLFANLYGMWAKFQPWATTFIYRYGFSTLFLIGEFYMLF